MWCVPEAPPAWQNPLLSFNVSPSGQGKAGAAWGCRPTEHPLPTPADNPAGLSGRPLLAWFGRLLGKADTHHTCSQRPLRRDEHRATPRAPMGSAEPRGLRERSLEPTERWAEDGAAKGRAVSWRFFLILKDGMDTGPLCAWSEAPLLVRRPSFNETGASTPRRPTLPRRSGKPSPEAPLGSPVPLML